MNDFLTREKTEQQGTEQWLKTRKQYVTATDVSNAKSNNDWLKSKFGPSIENRAIRHGSLLEPISRDIFNKMNKVKVHECGFISHKYIDIGASPDGWFQYTDNMGRTLPNLPACLIEIKNPFTRVISNIIPFNYWIQMQIQLLVCELEVCYYFETAIKFKQQFTKEDTRRYQYYGKCTKELTEYGKYWYLEDYFMSKCERDNKWIENNMDFIKDMVHKLKTKNKKKGRKRTFREMDVKDIVNNKDYYYNENCAHNYLNCDTLSDWFNMWGKIKYPNIKQELDSFTQAVKNYNKVCTSSLRRNLIDNYKILYRIKTIPKTYISPFDPPIDLHKMTIDYMKNDIDIIMNPLLIDQKNKHYSNMFALVKGRVLCEETNINDINSESYYPFIFKKKRFKVFNDDPDTLTNDRQMREIKCSALFHYKLLQQIQDTSIDRVFILGWGYEIKGKKKDFNLRNELFKNRFQILKINQEKELLQKCDDALRWLNLCKKDGMNWDPYNLNDTPYEYRKYLLPNVCNKNNWSEEKKKLAKKYDDVGTFWNIGSEKRRELFDLHIYSWKDPKFLDYIDTKFKKNNEIMRHMVLHNTSNKYPTIYLPHKKIKNTINDWNKSDRLEFYVDFETINTSAYHKDVLYLIGMYIKFPDNSVAYHPYMLEELTIENEADLVEIWINDMMKLKRKYRCKYEPNLFCWGDAERQIMNGVIKRMDQLDRPLQVPITFIDMCKIFKTEPILVKGAHEGFGLKTILPRMVEHKLIEKIEYKDLCNRGDTSIVHAIEYYNRKDEQIKRDLINYNEIDCKALMKIVQKIRQYC